MPSLFCILGICNCHLAIYIQVDREEESRVWQEVCMPVSGAKERIDSALQGWSGVTAQPHRFGGTEYRLGRREIGHVHGDRLVDIPFPKKIRDELVAAGRAEPHHILPESGWVSIYLREVPDVERAIELLRLSFEIANERIAK